MKIQEQIEFCQEKQIEFCQEMEKKFLDLDRQFLQYDSYDGVFANDAEMVGNILASLQELTLIKQQ